MGVDKFLSGIEFQTIKETIIFSELKTFGSVKLSGKEAKTLG
jgi:hypothetical protein